jgi:putative hemolysin
METQIDTSIDTKSVTSLKLWPKIKYFLERKYLKFSPRYYLYRPKVEVLADTTRYKLMSAQNAEDCLNVFRLRHQCFLEGKKFGEDKNWEWDRFDTIADHIMIICKETDEVVGTYRIIDSELSNKFYSQLEFDIEGITKLKGKKLELGRACIKREHRNGRVLDLLWKGIGQYIVKSQADYLFGCSSCTVTNKRDLSGLFQYIKSKNWYSDQIKVSVQMKHDWDEVGDDFTPSSDNKYEGMVSALMKSYIHAGAKICGRPAYDKEFECADLITVLKIDDLTPVFRKRYLRADC